MRRFIVLLALLGAGCHHGRLDDESAALVNKEAIKKNDLVYSVEFFPQVAPNQSGRDQVRAHLNLLIEKKLFAQEARRQGYDRNEHVRKVTDWVEREEMIKALYQQEIRDQVVVSEEELQAAFQKENRQVRLRHLLIADENQALQLTSQLQNGVPFEELAQQTFRDSTLRRNGGDLGFVSYFDLDPALADTAFSLPVGRVSRPLRSRWGYHLLRVDDQRQRVFAGQSEYNQVRSKLERLLRRRQEAERAGRFVTRFTDPLDIKMLNESFQILAAQVRDIVIEGDRLLPAYQPALNGAELDRLHKRLAPQGDRPLILFRNGQWTIDDFLSLVQKLPLPRRPRIDTPNHLRHDIGVLIRDELLYKEAQQRRLDRDPAVMAEVTKWRDDYMFSEWWQDTRDTIRVDEAEQQEYYAAHRGRYLMPERVHVRDILVASEAEAAHLLQRIRRGEAFAELAGRFSLRKTAAAHGGDLGLLQRNQYGNVSLKAFEISDQQVTGPVPVQGGYSIVQRLRYEPSRPMTFAEAQDQVLAQAVAARQQQVYQSHLARLREGADIVINEPLLQSLSDELFSGRERLHMVGGSR